MTAYDVNAALPANMTSKENTLGTGQGAALDSTAGDVGATVATLRTVAQRTSAYLNTVSSSAGAYGYNTAAAAAAIAVKVETCVQILKDMGFVFGTA